MDNALTAAGLLEYGNRAVKAPSARAPGGKGIDKSSALYAQCQEFESIFVKTMLKTMKQSVQKSGLVDGGMAEDIFQDMLYDEYALSMSRNASFGIADQIYIQLDSAGAYGASSSS